MALAQAPDPPGTGLAPLAMVFRDAAVLLDEAGQHEASVLRWTKVVELDPDWVEGWCRLGDAAAAAGDAEHAHRAWRQGAFHPLCVESQGRAWLDEHPDWALQRFEALASLLDHDPRTDLLQARALARLSPERGRDAMERYLVRSGELSDELLLTTLEVVEGLEQEDALALIRRVGDLDPVLAEAFAERRLELEVDLRAEELMGAAPVRLDLAQQTTLATARSLLAAGRLSEARRTLEALADQVARNPQVWATLADVREAQGDVAGAEAALQLARQLAPLKAGLHARYADLLVTWYGGRFDEEALDALERALDMGESEAVLRRHAELCERMGRAGCAIRSLTRLSELGVEGLQLRLANLRRERPEPLVLPGVPLPDGVDAAAWRALHRSRVFEERARLPGGGWDDDLLRRAVEEADRALQADTPEALNQRAHLHVLVGEVPDAMGLYERSLSRRPDQIEVLGRVAELAVRQQAPGAASRLRAAADAGDAWALVTTAERHLADLRVLAAWTTLERYFDLHASGPDHRRAVDLRARTRTLLTGGIAAVVGLALLFLGVPLWRAWHRRRGVGLQRFVDAHPRLAPDVVRILSSIRHEVVKHNVSALPLVAEKVVDGGEVSDRWLEARLFGGNGAVVRFRGYVDQLDGLARKVGVRLNLRYRDPIFRHAIPAMDRIASAAGRPLRPSLASMLADQAEVLNGVVYDGLGRFVRDACLLDLEPGLIQAAWAAVVAEQDDGTLPMAFAVTGGFDGRLRIARADLHDILVNLLRNAVEASLEEGRGRIEVALGAQEDFVTGLVRVEIRVCDQVGKRLTTAMIRGRYIDRGLGLAVDLTSRSGGSIHVEAAAGFAKAVVVRLPAEET